MKKLIDIFQEIDNILILLDQIMYKEYNNLLDTKTDIKKLFLIIKKKHDLLNQLSYLKKTKISLEQKYNVFPPYLNSIELSDYSNKIINKCVILNKMNLKNKKLTKHKFYLNQNFLNFYKSFKNHSIYDVYGNLEN